MARGAFERTDEFTTSLLEIEPKRRVVRALRERAGLACADCQRGGLSRRLAALRDEEPEVVVPLRCAPCQAGRVRSTRAAIGEHAPRHGARAAGKYESRPAPLGPLPTERRHRAHGERRSRCRKAHAARVADHQRKPRTVDLELDVERERSRFAAVRDTDGCAVVANEERDLRRRDAKQATEPRSRPRLDRGARCLDDQALEHASTVTEPCHAARHVDREPQVRERHGHLDDRQAAERDRRGELEADPRASDGEAQLGLWRGLRRWLRLTRAAGLERGGGATGRHDRGEVSNPPRTGRLSGTRASTRLRYEPPVRARDVLGPGSRLSQQFSRYEDRPGQAEMADAVEAALLAERPLFVEAGTGTGKTLAYLVPAILSGKRVVVSTATKALQEQIFTKDIPLLERVLAADGVRFRAALMKGLPNYVCKRRLAELLGFAPDGVSGSSLSRLLGWVERDPSGDRSELATVPEDDPIWREVSSSTETRIGSECRYFDECFVTRMRRQAEQAELIVVNHHLFFADLALRAGRGGERASAIPPYDAVIFDEAHQIEEVATDFFGSRVSSARVESLVRDASRSLAAARLGVGSLESRVARLLDQTLAAAQSFFRALGGGGAPGRRTLGPSDVGPSALAAHGKLGAALEALAGYAEGEASRGEAVALVARRARDLRADLARIVDGAFVVRGGREGRGGDGEGGDPDGGVGEPEREAPTARASVAWLDVTARAVSLGSSPVDLGVTLRRALFDRVQTVICTSATLATSVGDAPPGFHYAKARLGAPPEALELIVASPFDFASRAGLYLPRDLPEPADPAFEAASVSRVLELLEVTGGGAFVLCTSNRAMKGIHEGLRHRWKNKLLLQGEAPKHVLLDEFRAHEDAVLVATLSFWEGVDVPGRALRLVVLDKIPFAVPTDPIVAARSAEVDRQGGNSFAEYSIPAAAITLKQGFGRLLRTQEDAGIVAILDRRIVTRGYGKRLLASLPPARRLSRLDEVRAFWATVALTSR